MEENRLEEESSFEKEDWEIEEWKFRISNIKKLSNEIRFLK